MIRITLNFLAVMLISFCGTFPAVSAELPDPAETVRQEASRGKYQLIDVDDLWELYQDKSRDVLLVDTRQEWEHRTGHIDESELFSMEPTWFARLTQRHALSQVLGPDKERILVFY